MYRLTHVPRETRHASPPSPPNPTLTTSQVLSLALYIIRVKSLKSLLADRLSENRRGWAYQLFQKLISHRGELSENLSLSISRLTLFFSFLSYTGIHVPRLFFPFFSFIFINIFIIIPSCLALSRNKSVSQFYIIESHIIHRAALLPTRNVKNLFTIQLLHTICPRSKTIFLFFFLPLINLFFFCFFFFTAFIISILSTYL
jgi:hypothetical protein